MKNEALQDGVYLDLPEDEYFAQPRLGSTDLAKLYKQGRGWWWQSRHNPKNNAPTTRSMTFGRALHARLLEGRPALLERFAVSPSEEQFERVLKTQAQIKDALQAGGHPTPGSKASKADYAQYARLYMPDAVVWDDVLETFDRERGAKEAISADELAEVDLMAELAMEEPNLRAVMVAEDGVPMTELSVLWTTKDGIMLRYRFDSFLPDGNVDLKAIAGSYGAFEDQVGRRIRDYDLEVQMAQSMEARRAAYRLIRAGKIFGKDQQKRGWLKKFPKHAPLNAGGKPGWAWLWIFYQRPDARQGMAPTILPAREVFGGDVHREGYRKLAVGLRTYREAVERFGLDRPWTTIMPTHSLTGAGEHTLRLPPWNIAPLRQEGEDAALDFTT